MSTQTVNTSRFDAFFWIFSAVFSTSKDTTEDVQAGQPERSNRSGKDSAEGAENSLRNAKLGKKAQPKFVRFARFLSLCTEVEVGHEFSLRSVFTLHFRIS